MCITVVLSQIGYEGKRRVASWRRRRRDRNFEKRINFRNFMIFIDIIRARCGNRVTPLVLARGPSSCFTTVVVPAEHCDRDDRYHPSGVTENIGVVLARLHAACWRRRR